MDKKYLISKLFNDIAINLNTTDLKKAESAYYAVFKSIVRNLRTHGIVFLPDIGHMAIKNIKSVSTPVNAHNPSSRAVYGEFSTIKFYPCDKLKLFIKSFIKK